MEALARAAVEETGFGNVPDKIIKNTLAAVNVPRAIRGMRTVGILREDREKGIVEVASPVGVVAAVIPSTNPTSTAIYKTLISIKAQNAIVLSPHPSAIKCICQAATLLDRAALAAGAPEGLINCMQHTTLEGTRELMRHREVGVILATGGTGLVRAAYGSGKPAYGVGPGNVPAFIERTADVRKAVADIIAGKTFDYGTICSSEQAIVAEESVRERALEECRAQGAYFLSPEEMEKVGTSCVSAGNAHAEHENCRPRGHNDCRDGRNQGAARDARADRAPGTRTSGPRVSAVGGKIVADPRVLRGAESCRRASRCAAGCSNSAALGIRARFIRRIARRFWNSAQAMPAFRVVVNSASVHGSIGYSTNLFPAMTLGCGAPGGNITSDNIGPQHLMNVKTDRLGIARRRAPHVPADQRMAGGMSGGVMPISPEVFQAEPSLQEPAASLQAPAPSPNAGLQEKKAVAPAVPAPAAGVDRAMIARIVETVLAGQGIVRGSGAPKPAPAIPEAKDIPHPSSIAAEIAGRFFSSPPRPKSESCVGTAVPAAESSPAQTPASPAATRRPESPAKPAVAISPFVSENDVRRAMTRSEKIFVGPKTILTPSARDLGLEHEIFVETEAGSIR